MNEQNNYQQPVEQNFQQPAPQYQQPAPQYQRLHRSISKATDR